MCSGWIWIVTSEINPNCNLIEGWRFRLKFWTARQEKPNEQCLSRHYLWVSPISRLPNCCNPGTSPSWHPRKTSMRQWSWSFWPLSQAWWLSQQTSWTLFTLHNPRLSSLLLWDSRATWDSRYIDWARNSFLSNKFWPLDRWVCCLSRLYSNVWGWLPAARFG